MFVDCFNSRRNWSRRGSASSEYGLTAALVILMIIGSITALGWLINEKQEGVVSALELGPTETQSAASEEVDQVTHPGEVDPAVVEEPTVVETVTETVTETVKTPGRDAAAPGQIKKDKDKKN